VGYSQKSRSNHSFFYYTFKMNTFDAIKSIELEWDIDNGFLGKLRQGIIDKVAFERFISRMKSIEIHEDNLPRRFVSLVWYIPTFVRWQKERCIKNGTSDKDFDIIEDRTIHALEEILGIP
jgi:hypothetical protein